MKNNFLSIKKFGLLVISLFAIVILSSFMGKVNVSADANAVIPYVSIQSSGTFYLPSDGGEIELSGTASATVSAINHQLMLKGVDYITVTSISNGNITIEVSPNTFGYEIVIAVGGGNGGNIRIIQEG